MDKQNTFKFFTWFAVLVAVMAYGYVRSGAIG